MQDQPPEQPAEATVNEQPSHAALPVATVPETPALAETPAPTAPAAQQAGHAVAADDATVVKTLPQQESVAPEQPVTEAQAKPVAEQVVLPDVEPFNAQQPEPSTTPVAKAALPTEAAPVSVAPAPVADAPPATTPAPSVFTAPAAVASVEAASATVSAEAPVPAAIEAAAPASADVAPAAAQTAPAAAVEPTESESATPDRSDWLSRLKAGLKKTGSNISAAFGASQVDESLYDELQDALLMADAGMQATGFLLADLRERARAARASEPAQVRALLVDAIADLLQPLQKPLVIGEHTPTVIMVAGVNGAGKTTSIGKLTRHLSEAGQNVLLAAADTFRAAAREQLAVWADRNRVEIVSSAGGDPAALSFDAVAAGKARNRDVVLVDTAGRLPTQIHLMDELKKIRRTISKADATAPHEVLLVIDGNTGQNALAQVKAFDEALQLTGLIVTKLDGTARGGVLCAIARERPVPVYFVGVGEKLEDLQTFRAREFAEALLGG